MFNKPNLNIKTKNDTKEKQLQWVTELKDQFQRIVKKPIQLKEQTMKKGDIQRCLKHNIMYSIYCSLCRKMLCASCMYSSSQHRRHRVIPVQDATQMIQEDIKAYQPKIPKIIASLQEICNDNNQILGKFQKEFNPLILQIQRFYQNLKEYLKRKEKQQIQYLKQKRESIRNEINSYNRQIESMNQYITQKYKTYTITNLKKEMIIPSKSIIEILILSAEIIKDPNHILYITNFNMNKLKINEVQDEIAYRIQHIFPFFQQKIVHSKVLGSNNRISAHLRLNKSAKAIKDHNEKGRKRKMSLDNNSNIAMKNK